MPRRSTMVAASLALLLLPGTTFAGRGRYNNTPAMGLDGPIYNPATSPEWRKAGGNPYVYQQLMEQKMVQQQQKESQAYQKQMNAYLKANPQVKKQLEEQQKQAQRRMQAQPVRKKKKTTTAKAADVAKREEAPVAGAPPKPALSAIRAKTK